MADVATLMYAALGAAGAILFFRLRNKQRRVDARKRRAGAEGLRYAYKHSQQPIVPLKDVLFSKQVAAKDAKLVRREVGPAGTVKYVYYLPHSNQLTFSYTPLDFHTAH